MHTDPLTASRYPDSTDSPNVAQYIQNAVIDLADNGYAGPFATTTARDSAFAAWVALGHAMYDGLHCWVTGTGAQTYTAASGWVTSTDGTVPFKRQRLWTFGRTGNASDVFANGSFIVVQAATITSAPAGDYAITARWVISNSTASTGFVRCTAAGTAISPSDPFADTTVSGARQSFIQSGGITHTGGNMDLRSYYQANAGSPTVYSQGTEIAVSYLGPH